MVPMSSLLGFYCIWKQNVFVNKSMQIVLPSNMLKMYLCLEKSVFPRGGRCTENNGSVIIGKLLAVFKCIFIWDFVNCLKLKHFRPKKNMNIQDMTLSSKWNADFLNVYISTLLVHTLNISKPIHCIKI